MIDGIDRYAIDGNVGRTKLPALPVFATILGFEQAATPDRPDVHTARIPRVEGDPARAIARQSLGAAIVPASASVLGFQEPTAVGSEQYMIVIARIDGDRVTVLAGAALEQIPPETAPIGIADGAHKGSIEIGADVDRPLAVDAERVAQPRRNFRISPRSAAIDTLGNALRRSAGVQSLSAFR